MDMKHSEKVLAALFEAYRRNCMKDPFERQKPLRRRWLGLGTEAFYREAIHAGMMEFHNGEIPPPRCMGWLVLTEKGIDALMDLSADFAERMREMENTRTYKESMRAQYMLAGGRSS